eukprot:gene13893-15331_t
MQPYRLIQLVDAHSGPIRSLSYGPTDNEILTGCHANICRWRLSKDRVQIAEEIGSPMYHDHCITTLTSLSPSENLPLPLQKGCIISGCMDTKIHIFDLLNNLISTLEGHFKGVISFSWLSSCLYPAHLLSGSFDGVAILWNLNNFQQIRSFGPHESSVHVLGLSNNLIATTSSSLLRFWDPMTGQLVGNPINTGMEFVYLREDGLVVVWRGTGLSQTISTPTTNWVTLRLTDTAFATGGQDGILRIFSKQEVHKDQPALFGLINNKDTWITVKGNNFNQTKPPISRKIHVTGRDDFVCPVGWTVEQAEKRIRDGYGLAQGFIRMNGVVLDTNDNLIQDGVYHFVDYFVQQYDGNHEGFNPTLIKEKITIEDIPDNLPIDDNASNHASKIFGDPDVCKWFVDNVVEAKEWTLDHPHHDVPSNWFPLNLSSYFIYCSKFEEKGLKLWDIYNDYYASIRLNLVSKVNPKRSINLSGRADYLITKNDISAPESLSHALCAIVQQSRTKLEEECEHHLEAYLFLLMNKYGLLSVTGILILVDGRCRAYKAIRNSHRGCLYHSNDTFNIFYLADVVEKILKDLQMI